LDGKGEAQVILHAWFEQVYSDFRYTLTPIGAPAVLYSAANIEDNRFTLARGKRGLEVSWQVAGVRQDRYAKEHPLRVEVGKAEYPEPQLVARPVTRLERERTRLHS